MLQNFERLGRAPPDHDLCSAPLESEAASHTSYSYVSTASRSPLRRIVIIFGHASNYGLFCCLRLSLARAARTI